MWDTEAAARYESWFQTPAGAFALQAEKRLLHRLISCWPRRCQSLLEVGCGTGLFLESFYEAGFDVTGLDSSQDMLAAARKRLGHKAELQCGTASCLPFDDREFDFVAMLTVLEFLPKPLEALQEARRVARKGLLVAFLNRHSLYYLSHGLELPFLRASAMRRAHWFSPREMRRMLQQVAPNRPVSLRGVLPGPDWTWRDTPPLGWCNSLVLPLCLGAYGAARVNLFENAPLTPLPAFAKERRSSRAPANATLTSVRGASDFRGKPARKDSQAAQRPLQGNNQSQQ